MGEIQTLTEPDEWRHVPGKLNPADEATRSELSPDFTISDSWFYGPKFLYEEEEKWPQDLTLEVIAEEIRPKWEFKAFPTVVQEPERWINVKKLGKYSKAVSCTARMLHWTKHKRGQAFLLDIEDLSKAEAALLRKAQDEDFSEEIKILKRKQELPRTSSLIELYPFLDKVGLLRVGGRVGKASLPYDAKHPIIIHPIYNKNIRNWSPLYKKKTTCHPA